MGIRIEQFFIGQDVINVSLSILPQDHFFPERYPLGNLNIFFKNEQLYGIRNYSGYYVFINLEDGEYTVRIESEYYHTKEFTVILPSDSSPPGGTIPSDDEDLALQDYNSVLVVTATLRPKTTYPFPSGSSLIRGIVFDGDNSPLSGATVSVVGKEIKNVTTEAGEFVLYFTKLTRDDVVINSEGKKLVKGGDGTQEIRIEADHPDLGVSPQFTLELEEGTTASASIFYP